MSAVIELAPLTEGGYELLEQFEERTANMPFKIDARGARTYALPAEQVDRFQRTLHRINPDWREHLREHPAEG